jgi:D-inositol-3-phosphate glycosyltransferase
MFSVHSSPIGKLGTKDTGGMSVYIRELARELGQRGHRVDIYTLLRDGIYHPVMDIYENVRLIHLAVENNGNTSKMAMYACLPDFFRSLEIYRTAENLNYDLIHSHYWLSGNLGHWAQRVWKRPHLVMFHTLGAVKNSTGVGLQEPDLRIAVEKRIIKTCHRILAPTRREKQRLISYYGAPSEKIEIIPCGVNLNRFYPIEKTTAREKLALDPDDNILLYVGRFDPLKGLSRLLEAMAYLKNHHQLRLLIVGGDGDDHPATRRLQQKAAKLGIVDKVSFAGRIEQENLPPYYAAADTLVIPSYYESFGLVGLEALACGRPVVSTPVGAMEGILRQDETGKLVTDMSPQSLATGIEAVIADFALFSTESIRASVLDYSWSTIASAVLEQYRGVFKQPRVVEKSIFSAEAALN